ncbi:hypothetical protein [Streptomyces sp. TLI_235]|nr:hypothetical protein [Streptomyces sp. TLI_235]
MRLHRDARLELHRRGAQDRPHADPADYLAHLHATYRGGPLHEQI